MSQHRPGRGAALVALVCVLSIGLLSIGTAAGAGPARETSAPRFDQVTLAAIADASGSAAPAPATSTIPSAAPPAAVDDGTCPATATVPPATAGAAPAPSPAPPTDAPTTKPVAAFLGDSYTTGYAGAGLGRAGWPAIVGASLGLRVENLAVAGTGFVNPGWTGQPIRTQVSAVVRANPRIVFLAGGHNDRRYAATSSAAAADAVIGRLHSALPDTILVVIGPIWQDGSPPRSIRALRDHLRQTAASVGAMFIDPLQGEWFAGTSHRLIGPDGIHPTNAGHRHIAGLVLQAVRADARFSGATASAAPATPTPTPTPALAQGSGTLAHCGPDRR